MTQQLQAQASFTETDDELMREALRLARQAASAGEVPIGAVVAMEGRILGRGENRVIRDHDTTAHAEIVALRDAFAAVNNYRVPGATLYTTVEPCAMCAGALMHARVSRVVWGAPDWKFGAAGSIVNLFAEPRLNHHAREVCGGLFSLEAAQLLSDFFSSKRRNAMPVTPDTATQAPQFVVKTANWKDDQSTLKGIRFDVFVDEQKVPAEIELDEFDAVSLHAIAWVDGKAAACGRLLPDGHIGRMAVRKPWRGQGAGAAVLRHLVEKAKQRGDRDVVLSSQAHAMGFYEKHGFLPEGDEYMEAGIPHRIMRKKLIAA